MAGAGILSGFIGIQTEEHSLHVRAFREELSQRLARHPAQRQIIVLLPVFREQFDEGQQVDGGFKDQQLLVSATVGKAKRLFCTGRIDLHSLSCIYMDLQESGYQF